MLRSGVGWPVSIPFSPRDFDTVRSSTSDLRCIQCHVVDMTLDAPKISC